MRMAISSEILFKRKEYRKAREAGKGRKEKPTLASMFTSRSLRYSLNPLFFLFTEIQHQFF
jgi:hypothetical protein